MSEKFFKPKVVKKEGLNEHGHYEVEYVPDHDVTSEQMREKIREIVEKEGE